LENFLYEIRVEGLLKDTWCDWFEGLDLHQEGNQTLMILTARDPAQLHGVLGQIASLNLRLISIQRIQVGNPDDP
jgi:hypothetical protein